MEALHDQVLQEAPFHNLRYFWKQFHRGNSNDLGFRASGAVKDGYLFGSICFRFRKGDNRNVNVDSAFQAIPVLSFTTNVDETVAGVRKTEVMVCKANRIWITNEGICSSTNFRGEFHLTFHVSVFHHVAFVRAFFMVQPTETSDPPHVTNHCSLLFCIVFICGIHSYFESAVV